MTVNAKKERNKIVISNIKTGDEFRGSIINIKIVNDVMFIDNRSSVIGSKCSRLSNDSGKSVYDVPDKHYDWLLANQSDEHYLVLERVVNPNEFEARWKVVKKIK